MFMGSADTADAHILQGDAIKIQEEVLHWHSTHTVFEGECKRFFYSDRFEQMCSNKCCGIHLDKKIHQKLHQLLNRSIILKRYWHKLHSFQPDFPNLTIFRIDMAWPFGSAEFNSVSLGNVFHLTQRYCFQATRVTSSEVKLNSEWHRLLSYPLLFWSKTQQGCNPKSSELFFNEVKSLTPCMLQCTLDKSHFVVAVMLSY